MEYFRSAGLYEIVDRAELERTGGKIIGIRWIDTNKADGLNPEYRSRELRTEKDDSLYAGTPPLESLRFIVSLGCHSDW